MAFDYSNSQVLFDNNFMPFTDANLNIASSPVLYGLTIYTVFSLNWNEHKKQLYAFRLREHYERLVNSARIMDFGQFIDEWDFKRFEDSMLELIRRNDIKEDALVRVAVYVDELVAGTKIHGLKNSLSAFIYPMGEILPLSGIDVCVSSWVRTPDNAIPSRAKINGSYINASLMKNEALLNGYHEAIALDHNGHVAEGTVANLFIIRNGALITPDNSTDILEGITRSSIIQIAQDMGLEIQQKAIDRSELYIADEMFMCGSSARITPILSVDKRPVKNGKIGPTTKELMKLYKDIQQGVAEDTNHWLTSI